MVSDRKIKGKLYADQALAFAMSEDFISQNAFSKDFLGFFRKMFRFF